MIYIGYFIIISNKINTKSKKSELITQLTEDNLSKKDTQIKVKTQG